MLIIRNRNQYSLTTIEPKILQKEIFARQNFPLKKFENSSIF